MTKSVYIAAPEALAGKTTIAMGAIEALAAGGKVGVFRPVIETIGHDASLDSLLEQADSGQSYDQGYGVTYSAVREDRDQAITTIIQRFDDLCRQFESVVVVGSDYSDVISPIEFSLNVQIAANLNAPLLLVLPGRSMTPRDLRHAVDFCLREIDYRYAEAIGALAINVDPDSLEAARTAMVSFGLPITAALPGTQPPSAVLPRDFATLLESAAMEFLNRVFATFQFEAEELDALARRLLGDG